MWTHRIMLEGLMHTASSFVTLTYADEHLSTIGTSENGTATLVPKDFQDWLKRFRKRIEPLKIRYYGVGEYGELGERPHYHAILFGFPPCRSAQTKLRNGIVRCCDRCTVVSETWGKGNICLGTMGVHSAQYVCGYVTKKLTNANDPNTREWLKGRHPEFCRMSLRPGIGADAMHQVASDVMTLGLDVAQGDVPSALRHGARMLPLGRYLRRLLRTYVGLPAGAPQSTLDEVASKMRAVYESLELPSALSYEFRQTVFKNALVDLDEGKVAAMDARGRIYKQRRRL